MTYLLEKFGHLRFLKNKYFVRLIDAFIAAILVTAAAYWNLIEDIDLNASDWLYQKPSVKSEDIIVIGIDSATLDKFGPLPTWGRREIAKAIEILDNDKDNRPAVIGVDLLFSGDNPLHGETSQKLADAVANYKNVVVASMADEYRNNIIEKAKNEPYKSWSPPYEKLLEVAETGHINALYDSDGIVRHALLYVDIEGRERLYSFGKVTYDRWCKVTGTEKNPLPKTEANGVYYLPFTAESYSCGYNFLDLVEGKIPAEIYKNKIVLIGPYAFGMMDEATTALNRSNLMYGIDIHANIINAFQKNFFPRELDNNFQLIILFLIAFVSEIIFREKKFVQVIFFWLAICLGWFGICKIFYLNEIILHVAWVPIFVTVLFIISIMTNYQIRVREENVRLTTTLGRYFDPAVMKELLAGSPDIFALGGKSQEIVVLFVDIRGFTSMSEKMSAETVVEILNEYLSLTTKCIFQNHGTLDKFIGDATMAFWNLPPEEKPAQLACQAALDMISEMKTLNAEIKSKFGVDISFGIGINQGRAVVGNIGTENRMDYTAIGDTVNTAARLESNAEGGQILITRSVAEALGDSAEVEQLNKNITLKGKSKGFEILVLKSLKEWR